jgi:hypothetical protein
MFDMSSPLSELTDSNERAAAGALGGATRVGSGLALVAGMFQVAADGRDGGSSRILRNTLTFQELLRQLLHRKLPKHLQLRSTLLQKRSVAAFNQDYLFVAVDLP